LEVVRVVRGWGVVRVEVGGEVGWVGVVRVGWVEKEGWVRGVGRTGEPAGIAELRGSC
jgi:hypothetical protein